MNGDVGIFLAGIPWRCFGIDVGLSGSTAIIKSDRRENSARTGSKICIKG